MAIYLKTSIIHFCQNLCKNFITDISFIQSFKILSNVNCKYMFALQKSQNSSLVSLWFKLVYDSKLLDGIDLL